MNLQSFKGAVGGFVTNNATTLLTAGGVVGVVGTAVLSARAGIKAGQVIDDLNREKVNDTDEVVTTQEKVMATWRYFVPPVVCGSLTIAAIIMSNRVSAKEAAALAAAYGLSQRQLDEYRAKVMEKVGVNKHRAIQDAIAQDQVDENPPSKEVLILGEGQVLFYDALSGRYFQSTVDKVRKAENSVNYQLFHYQICSLSHFYEELGLRQTDLSDGIGWNMSTSDDKQLELKLSTTMTDDEKPCIVISFNSLPKYNYEQLY